MRRLLTPSLTAVALLAMPAPAALAHSFDATAIGLPDPTADFQSSDNVTHVLRMPQHQGSAGGRLLDGRFYVTDPRGVHVYDVSDPLAPVLLGSLTLFQTNLTNAVLGQEDPDTNGRILLLDGTNPEAPDEGIGLHVVDVSDPADMSVIAEVDVTDHTWTCVADCTYAYGRTGHIVDLTDPSNPELLATTWKASAEVDPGYTHDFTEVAPGRLFSAGQPSVYLDTTDPAAPTLLTQIDTSFHTLGYHGVEWARDGQDSLVVLGTEIAPDDATGEAGSDCQAEGSVIQTYRTTDVLASEARLAEGARTFSGQFELLDSWKVEGRGVGPDGQAPFHVLYCAHWFNLHPEFSDGGLFAAGYYDWGTRIVQVAADGSMSEYGWYLPSDGYTASSYWVSRDVLYTLDYVRGLEILQVDVEAPADPSPEGEVAAGELDFEDLPAPDDGGGPTTPVTGSGLAGLAIGTLGLGLGLRRRRAA